jgi:ParB-like chromosome segregation protein Spo0J
MSKRADDAPRKEVKGYDPHDVIIIGLDTDDGPSHPLCDVASNDAPLIESDILFTYEHGIIQPVSAKRDGDRILIVFGRGRTRQLREANKRRIANGQQPWMLPVQIVKGDSIKMLALKVGENSHRREIDPMARARDAYDLAQQMPEEKAAVIMGLGLQQFRNVIKLLDLAPVAAKAVAKGQISPTAAAELAVLSEEQQGAKLAELTANGHKPTVRDAQAKVREASGKEPIETPKMRLAKVMAVLDKLDDFATKDDLWSAIRKIRKAAEK